MSTVTVRVAATVARRVHRVPPGEYSTTEIGVGCVDAGVENCDGDALAIP
jgi:hypothetical protein